MYTRKLTKCKKKHFAKGFKRFKIDNVERFYAYLRGSPVGMIKNCTSCKKYIYWPLGKGDSIAHSYIIPKEIYCLMLM